MEAPSAHGHRGRVPWQGILLAASLLTFWTPPITAKPTVEPEPPCAAEGQDVLLRVRDLPGYFGIYSWYKGGKVDSSQRIASYNVAMQEFSNGPAHSGREIMYPNISLLFKNVTQADTGEYTLQYINRDFVKEVATGQLCLHTFSAGHTEQREQVTVGTPATFPAEDTPGGSKAADRAGGETTGLSAEVIAAIVTGAVVGMVLAAALAIFLVCRFGRTSDKRGLPEHRPPASTPGSAPSGRSAFWAPHPDTKPDDSIYENCQPDTKSDCPIYEELQHPETNIYCWVNSKRDVVS